MKKLDKSSLHFWQKRNYQLEDDSLEEQNGTSRIHFQNIAHLDAMLYSKDMNSLWTSNFLDDERRVYADLTQGKPKNVLFNITNNILRIILLLPQSR